MDCKKISEKISLYIDGQLSENEMNIVSEHIKDCEKCRHEYEQLKSILQFVSEEPMIELPEDYKVTLNEKLKECKQEIPVKKNKKFKWKRYTAIAAGLVIMVMSVSMFNNKDFSKEKAVEENSTQAFPMENKDDCARYGSEVAEDSVDLEVDGIKPEDESILKFTGSDFNAGNSEITNNITSQNKTLKSKSIKLIKNINLAIEVDNFDNVIDTIKRHVRDVKGFIENSNEQYVYDGTKKLKRGYMVIRVPSEIVEDSSGFLQGLGDVVNLEFSAKNITKKYHDVDNEMKNLLVQEDRLREILKKAQNVEDILKIEDELRRINTKITSNANLLNNWDDLVNYSTIYLNINQKKYSEVVLETEGTNIWDDAKAGFVKNINKIITALENIFISIISYMPIIIPMLLCYVVVYVIYKHKRKQ